jgi:hypothetical protein
MQVEGRVIIFILQTALLLHALLAQVAPLK